MLTKLDGDARGGAALSVKAVTGKPIKFAGVGEKLDAIEVFHPDRMASRILGMGDVLTLIEKAEAAVDEKKAQELAEKLKKNRFTLTDYLDQLNSMKKNMGLAAGACRWCRAGRQGTRRCEDRREGHGTHRGGSSSP